MNSSASRLLAPFALFEWGAILMYFFFSRRLASFLHPSFRPMVFGTGLLLMITAACILFSGENAPHDCDSEGCERSHAKLTPAGILAFLVLLIPVALAAEVSPDGYGSALIASRGVADSLAGVPAAMARKLRLTLPPVAAGVVVSSGPASERDAQTVDLPKGWVPPNAPEFSDSKNIPEDEYPSNDALARKLRAPSNLNMVQAQKAPGAARGPMKALNERPGADTPLGGLKDVLGMADSALRSGGAAVLKNGEDGRAIALEVVDLLVAARDPALIQEITGKRVELIGQILPAEAHNFRLLRLLILCCAADAQPLAVRVETATGTKLPLMAWAKVCGKISFIKKAGGTIPVVKAESVTPIEKPDEPYLY